MRYENIKLTEEQRNKLIERKIKNPYGSFRDITEGISPIYLTVDKDSENWPAEGYFHHDFEQTLNEFTFMYENVPVFIQAETISQERYVTVKITRIDEKNGFNEKNLFWTVLRRRSRFSRHVAAMMLPWKSYLTTI